MSLSRKAKVVLTLSLEEAFPLLEKYKHFFTVDDKTFPVYMGGERYAAFLKNQDCVSCGRKGTHFRIHHDRKQQIVKWEYVINLFSEEGMMMTVDHIIPRSMGGKTHPYNLQVMCYKCNQQKGSKLPSPEVVAEITQRIAEDDEAKRIECMKNFREMSDNQLAVFEQIAINNDQGHSKNILKRLKQKGLIEQTGDNSYRVPIAIHAEWCAWCAEKFPNEEI